MRPNPPLRKPGLSPSTDPRIWETRQSPDDGPSGGSGPDYWVLQNVPLRPVLARLYDVPESRIELPEPLERRRYDLVLALPGPVTRETMMRLMREGVEREFGVTREQRVMDVDVLTAPHGIRAPESDRADHLMGFGSVGFAMRGDGPPTGPPDGLLVMELMNLHTLPSDSASPDAEMHRAMAHMMRAGFGTVPGTVAINSISQTLSMAQLCEILEPGLDRPLLDETGLTGSYAINVHAETVNTREFLRVLSDRIGLVVSAEQRDVSMVVAHQERAPSFGDTSR